MAQTFLQTYLASPRRRNCANIIYYSLLFEFIDKLDPVINHLSIQSDVVD